MMSERNDGKSISEVVGLYMGKVITFIMRVFSVVLLVMVGVNFSVGPAGLLAKTAKSFTDTAITLTKGDKTVKATQLMKLMGLGARPATASPSPPRAPPRRPPSPPWSSFSRTICNTQNAARLYFAGGRLVSRDREEVSHDDFTRTGRLQRHLSTAPLYFLSAGPS